MPMPFERKQADKEERAEFRKDVEGWVRERAGAFFSEKSWAEFAKRLSYSPGDATSPATYSTLREKLNGDGGGALFYLSTSPAFYIPIVKGLASVGLAKSPNGVIVEKPIGKSLKTCDEINSAIAEHFAENRTFRIDHYLGKETVQNLIALRFANTLFEPLWNNLTIDHVQITVAETEGVGDRWPYYDEYGALRDMVQNHMLQLLCLVAMEPPSDMEPDSVRNEKVKVLRSLTIPQLTKPLPWGSEPQPPTPVEGIGEVIECALRRWSRPGRSRLA